MIDRRGLVAGGAGLAATALLPRAARADDAAVTSTDLPLAVGSRTTRLFRIERAGSKPRGVVLFSTGHGSWPERYAPLTHALARAGWTVLAPLHVDSMHFPGREAFSMQASFGERLADMAAASTYAATTWPGRPVLAAGHSFGTLTALCRGGALAGVGPFRDPAVKAVLGFSTPGKVPGLIQPTAYASLAVPAMIVTGTADTVPGFVTDPADHLFPAQSTPAASYAIVVADGRHELVGDAAAVARLRVPVEAFVAAYGAGDARARARLDAWQAPAGDRFLVKATA